MLRNLKINKQKSAIGKFALSFSILSVLTLIYKNGVDSGNSYDLNYHFVFVISIIVGIISSIFRISASFKTKKQIAIFDSLYLFLLALILISNWDFFSLLKVLDKDIFLNTAIFLILIREIGAIRLEYKNLYLNPAQLFIISFILIIFIGSLLLMLPNATYQKISFVDALFTSTSAVCVTGLIVVDTATYFTEFGKITILVLIQIGGLGIMTFLSYFSFIMNESGSFKNRLILREITNSNKISEVFKTISNVVLITLLIEFLSAVLIFFSLDSRLFESIEKQMFFSLFHSISAFCNAGFSTYTNGLYEEPIKFNYFLQLIVAFTIILGGLGFSIIFNSYQYIIYKMKSLIKLLIFKEKSKKLPWFLNLNSRLVLISTAFLLLIGTVGLFILEYNSSFNEHGTYGKIVQAFFMSVSPRTAGFNSIDMTQITMASGLLIIFLMWVGGSPGSTAGGIKTSTFSILFLNIYNLVRGKDRLEIFRREISDITVKNTLAVITLSFLALFIGIFLISIFENSTDLYKIAFECFSAYSTVGLSLGITYDLTDLSKLTLVFLMFVGRVSFLTILISISKEEIYKSYKYPKEDITIN